MWETFKLFVKKSTYERLKIKFYFDEDIINFLKNKNEKLEDENLELKLKIKELKEQLKSK